VPGLYSRRVIGWAISERMTAALVRDAPVMALWNRRMPNGVTVHSDRGSQYCSAVYQKLFRKHRLISGMGKKGDGYDNTAMESWGHRIKVEAVHGKRFRTRSDAKHQAFEHIEVYYNRKRPHSRLGYLSPEAFEAKKIA
jgi:transposase InsO family protein